jgi:hypothetical protein
MVSSSQKRHAAQGVVAAGMCSQRQACRYLRAGMMPKNSSASVGVFRSR